MRKLAAMLSLSLLLSAGVTHQANAKEVLVFTYSDPDTGCMYQTTVTKRSILGIINWSTERTESLGCAPYR